jgi:predicted nucleic acid-binding protein
MPDQAFEPAVVNTGPILALSLLGVLDLLKKFYQPVYIASAVEQEIQYGGHGAPGYKEVKESDWLVKCNLQNPLPPLLSMELDPGEAETIGLALEKGVKRVLIDESIGRQMATYLGLRPTGTVGVILRAKKRGYISEVRPLLDNLIKEGFWLSQHLYGWAVAEANE